jgi:hypothetical protein
MMLTKDAKDILNYLNNSQDTQDAVYTFPRFKLQLHRSEMLASANFMQSVVGIAGSVHSRKYDHLICSSLRHDAEFMAQTQLVHLAPKSLLDSKEFAVRAYCNVGHTLRWFDASTKLYERLSLRVQSDREVVILAVRCEGRMILKLLPSSLKNDQELFKALVLHDVLCLKYAPSLRCNPDLLQLCACLIRGLQSATELDAKLARALSIEVGMSDALKFAADIQSSTLCNVVSAYALWGLTQPFHDANTSSVGK